MIKEPAERLSCVIFDIDGTLTRTSELIFASFNHITAKYLGTTLTPREIVALFGPPEEDAVIRLLGREKAVAATADLYHYYGAHHHALASLHPGVDDVLRFLKERTVKLAVFTGKGRRTTGITLQELGIAHYFDLIVSGSDVIHHKPHPEGIQKVLRAFDISASEALMVGDALSDVKASRSAGVRMALALWDSFDKESMAGADVELRFHEVGEMLAWFRAHIN